MDMVKVFLCDWEAGNNTKLNCVCLLIMFLTAPLTLTNQGPDWNQTRTSVCDLYPVC